MTLSHSERDSNVAHLPLDLRGNLFRRMHECGRQLHVLAEEAPHLPHQEEQPALLRDDALLGIEHSLHVLEPGGRGPKLRDGALEPCDFGLELGGVFLDEELQHTARDECCRRRSAGIDGLGLLQHGQLPDFALQPLARRRAVEELGRELVEIEEELGLGFLDAVRLHVGKLGEPAQQLLQPLLLGVTRHRILEQRILVEPLRIERRRLAGERLGALLQFIGQQDRRNLIRHHTVEAVLELVERRERHRADQDHDAGHGNEAKQNPTGHTEASGAARIHGCLAAHLCHIPGVPALPVRECDAAASAARLRERAEAVNLDAHPFTGNLQECPHSCTLINECRQILSTCLL